MYNVDYRIVIKILDHIDFVKDGLIKWKRELFG
jgi:hypothetical protein